MFDNLEQRAENGDRKAKRLLILIGWGLTLVLVVAALAFMFVAWGIYQMYMDQTG
jgi:flagellar basal body-associated protein FliL